MTTYTNFDIVTAVPSSAIADNGTQVFAYPSGKTSADYVTGSGAVLVVEDLGVIVSQGAGFTLAYSGSITATWTADTSIPAGSVLKLQIPRLTYETLTAANGTASNTIADVTATPTQTLVNNNFKSIADKLNTVINALKDYKILP